MLSICIITFYYIIILFSVTFFMHYVHICLSLEREY